MPDETLARREARDTGGLGLAQGAGKPALAVIIPTLNAARQLPSAMTALRDGAGTIREILVVDAGSTDGTAACVDALRDQGFPIRAIAAPRGRGVQLRLGAAETDAPWLLFLHADTRLGAGWTEAVEAFMAASDNRERAAAFTFTLDDNRPQGRWLERMVAWRCKVHGLPYGDQGLLISRAFYDKLGGYKAIPLMEDVELNRAIGKRRMRFLDVPALTSADRYRGGYVKRSARNLFCLFLWWLHVPPAWIARIYCGRVFGGRASGRKPW